jgi:hypothetical protein
LFGKHRSELIPRLAKPSVSDESVEIVVRAKGLIRRRLGGDRFGGRWSALMLCGDTFTTSPERTLALARLA